MSQTKSVPVSDEGAVEVRPLFLYEDDAVLFDDPGEFVLNYMLDIQTGQTKPVIHTLADFLETPEKPDKPREQCKPGSEEADMWASWTLFQAIVTHEAQRQELSREHAHNVVRYILENCLSAEDRQRIITPDDLQAVLAVALVQEITIQEVEAALAATFQSVMGWAIYLAGVTALAERQRGNDLNPLMGSPDPASVAA